MVALGLATIQPVKQLSWQPYRRLLALCWALFVLFGLSACQDDEPASAPSSQAALPKTLTLVTRPSATSFYPLAKQDQQQSEFAGFDYALAQQFASFLGRELQVISVNSIDALYQFIENGQADFAAAGLHRESDRQFIRFSPSYQQAQQVVLMRRNSPKIETLSDLKGLRIASENRSSHQHALDLAGLTWRSHDEMDSQTLMQQLVDEQIDASLVYLHEFYLFSSRYPELKVAYTLPQPQYLAWAMHSDNTYLQQQSQIFLQQLRREQGLSKLEETYYGHFKRIYEDGFNSRTFAHKVKNRLPKYQQMIQDVAMQHDLDWRLLAAIAYQESHWRPRAKSPTGVRGMMMLTLTTAHELGIENRLNARQSLEGGARYLQKIRQRLSNIPEPDKTWLALAAYNVGWGHLRDARAITDFQGADSNRWVEVKQRLPLLTQRAWYKYTDYGFARGNEPVTYVQRIRHYHDLLRWYFPVENDPLETQAEPSDVAVVDDANGKSG